MKDPRVVILRERLKIEPPAPPAPGRARPRRRSLQRRHRPPTMPRSRRSAATAGRRTPCSREATPAVDQTVVAATEPAPPPKPFDPEVFDDSVDTAVKAFQEQAGLKPDGVIGPATLGRLNAAADDHVDTILVNMERWRWMPEDLGQFYVRVNIPNFNLDIYKDGKVFYTTRIVVGQPTKQTPIFSDEIEYVIVNPTWNVPASIAVKEMLPQIQADPGKALNGYQVFANIGGRFRAVDPWTVDWRNVDMRRIQIKQPPGERNALGSIKFMFPNPFAVYLHDTPSKSLFQKDYRAYQPRLHAGDEPVGFCRGPAHPRSERVGGRPEEAGRRARDAGEPDPAHPGPHHLFHRLGGRFGQAAAARRRLRPRRPHGEGLRPARLPGRRANAATRQSRAPE